PDNAQRAPRRGPAYWGKIGRWTQSRCPRVGRSPLSTQRRNLALRTRSPPPPGSTARAFGSAPALEFFVSWRVGAALDKYEEVLTMLSNMRDTSYLGNTMDVSPRSLAAS